ncbi:hypothetical protein [Agromyces sp. ZXT2-6]|uniref:hypothetical protein n=1 Tax=Agromyces sp. ZXT2-6 TaxID=3461153 RepID=UPI004054D3FF
MVYLVDLSSVEPTAPQLSEITEVIQRWNELRPARVAVVFINEATAANDFAVDEFAGFQSVRLQSDSDERAPLPDQVQADLLTEKTAQVRGPLLLASLFATAALLLSSPTLDSWWPGVSFSAASFGMVLAACWTIWPPEVIASRLGTSVAVAIGVAVLMCSGLLASAAGSFPNGVSLWLALGSTATVAAFIVSALQRGTKNREFPNLSAVGWIGVLLATWFTVAADPALIALGLIGSLVAIRSGSANARLVVLSVLAALVAIHVGLALFALGPDATDSGDLAYDGFWPVLVGAIAIEAVIVLMIRGGGATQQIADGSSKPAFIGFGAWWIVLWMAAPLPWSNGVASTGALARIDGLEYFIVIGSSLLSVLLGIGGLLLCSLLGASRWVVRLALALPILAGIVAASPVSFSWAGWPAWVPTGLCVLVVLAIAPRRTEYETWSQAFGARNILHALALVAAASLSLGLLVSVFGRVAHDLLRSAFADVPLRDAPDLITQVWFYGSDVLTVLEAFRTPSGLTASLVLVGGLGLAWITPRLIGWSRFSALSTSWIEKGAEVRSRVDLRGVDVLAALAVGLLLAAGSAPLYDSTPLYPLLGSADYNLANLLSAVICVLVLIWAWRWRHGSADWLALLLILNAYILGSPGTGTEAGIVIGILAGALLIGGPSTILDSRRSTPLVNVVVCAVAVALCALAIWIVAGSRTSVDFGGVPILNTIVLAALFVPAIIVRPGPYSALSIRVSQFKRAGRRLAAVATVWVVLGLALSQLYVASLIQTGWVSEEELWPVFLQFSTVAILVVLGAYGWLHLGVLVLGAGARKWRWSRHLRREVARAFNDADASASAVMADHTARPPR